MNPADFSFFRLSRDRETDTLAYGALMPMAIIVMMLGVMLLALALREQPRVASSLISNGINASVGALAAFLTWRKRYLLAANVLLWTLWLATTYSIWMNGGLRAPNLFAYPILIVGAGWLMTSLSPDPLMVALVQAATTFPMFVLALPAGALADIVDRRRPDRRIASRHEPTGRTVLDQAGQPTDGRRDHRRATCGGLEGNETEGLGPAGHHTHIGSPVVRGQKVVRLRVDESHPARQAQRRDPRLHPAQLVSTLTSARTADHQQLGRRVAQFGERGQDARGWCTGSLLHRYGTLWGAGALVTGVLHDGMRLAI